MTNEAWNKIVQTHDAFKKIIAPLKEHLGIDFGYMIVFNDGKYFQMIENLECLQKWVTNVETSSIFCARNVTTYFDDPYNFTIWPEDPTCKAMEIYKEYGMWNGITVSKVGKDYTELYWFTKPNAEDGWQRWFIRNKAFLLKFIDCFKNYQSNLYVLENTKLSTFKFIKAFNIKFLESGYLKQELYCIKETIALLSIIIDSNENLQLEKFCCLSPLEKKVLLVVGQGYTAKGAARELNLSPKTVSNYIERIKLKTGLHFKDELIRLYKNV